MQTIIRYSMTLSASILLLILFLSSVSASDENPWPEEYTILCSSEERSGLNWVNGTWKPAQFKNTQRLIVKSKSNDCGGKTGGDSSNKEGNVYMKGACINEREMGKEYIPEKSAYCAEVYNDENFEIHCVNPYMSLSFNGWYHYAYINLMDLTDSKENQKESQYIEVGKCSMIKP